MTTTESEAQEAGVDVLGEAALDAYSHVVGEEAYGPEHVLAFHANAKLTGTEFRHLRENEFFLNITEMAKLLGVSPNTIVNWEKRGDAHLSLCDSLAVRWLLLKT